MRMEVSNKLYENLKKLLYRNSFTAANIRLKEILKRSALFGNQTVVLVIGSGALTNRSASLPDCLTQAGKPFFFLLL